jgi:hypothetical protein
MARRIYLLVPSAVAFAIFGCGGGTDPGLFGSSGIGGAGSAGAPSMHGAGASSTPPGSAGDTSNAGNAGLAGEDAGGASSGGSDTGGGDGEAGHSSSGGSIDQGGTSGSAGHAEGGNAGHAEGGSAGHAAGGTNAGGTAGAGTAGSVSSGGASAGGGNEPTCAQLLSQAATELTAARACNLAANAEQCTGAVETVCNCEVPVEKNGSAASDAYEATLKEIRAKHCSQVCPAIACLPVTRAQCRATTPESTKGSCVAGFAIPTPVPAF